MAVDFRVHVFGFQALRAKQIENFGWPSTVDVSNKILSKYLLETINPRFVREGSTFNPMANAYVHACNVQTSGHMKIVQFDSDGKLFEDYVAEQIDLNTDEILLKSLFDLAESGEIEVPSMKGVDSLSQLKGKKITGDDQRGLAAGMAILRNPMLPQGHLEPAQDIEFPNLGKMGDLASVGSTFGDSAQDAVL